MDRSRRDLCVYEVSARRVQKETYNWSEKIGTLTFWCCRVYSATSLRGLFFRLGRRPLSRSHDRSIFIYTHYCYSSICTLKKFILHLTIKYRYNHTIYLNKTKNTKKNFSYLYKNNIYSKYYIHYSKMLPFHGKISK